MPRLVVPRSRPTEHRRDYVVLALKVATFLAAVGVFGVVVLLAGTDELDSADAPPVTVETAPDGLAQNGPRLRLPVANTATASIEGTRTSEAPEPPPTTETEADVPAPPDSGERDDGRFVVQGAPCDDPGAYGFTDRYRPVVCYPAGGSATWEYMF